MKCPPNRKLSAEEQLSYFRFTKKTSENPAVQGSAGPLYRQWGHFFDAKAIKHIPQFKKR